MYFIDDEIVKVLLKDTEKFMKLLIEKNIINDFCEDPACNGFDDINYFMMLYVNHLLNNKNGVKLLKTRLGEHISNEKKINDFIYKILKLNYKMEKGIFSWFEASHFDIDFENIKDTKTKYEL